MVCMLPTDGFDASVKTLTAPLAPVTVPLLTMDCVPPPDTQTNAFSLLTPANRTSVGSSPTSIVRVTLPVERATTLTESDIQLTTQASRLVRAATLTGSRPTGISAVRTGAPDTNWKIDNVALGVFTASKRVPSGVRAKGWICGPSKFRNVGKLWAETTRERSLVTSHTAVNDRTARRVMRK